MKNQTNTQTKTPHFENNLDLVLKKLNLHDGMTLSFHHHLRNGDEVLNMVMTKIQQLGIKNIIAKANNERYKYVLERIGADTVIQPENEMGQRVAISLINPKIIDIYQITNDYVIMEIKVPELWCDKPLGTLNVREVYGVNIIGVRRSGDKKVETNVGRSTVLHHDDILVIAADSSRIASLDLD